MKKVKSYAILLLIFQAAHLHAQVTPTSDPVAFRKAQMAFYTDRIGAPFAVKDEWKCIDGASVNLYKTNRPAVVFLGFSSCHPCRNGLPFYAKVSNDNNYSDVDLVYITFDDSTSIMKELNESKIVTPNKVKWVSVDRKYIDASKMAERGYPVVYFLDKNKVVQSMYAGTRPHNDKLDSMGYWYSALNKIK